MEWVLGSKHGVAKYTANASLPIAGIQKMLDRRTQRGASSRDPKRGAD